MRSSEAAQARDFGAALGRWLNQRDARSLLLGRDCQLQSVELAAAAQAGLRSAGIDVIDAGISAAPARHHGARLHGVRAQLHVGADVLRQDSATLSVLFASAPVSPAEIPLLEPGRVPGARHVTGNYLRVDLAESYVARLAGDVRLQQPPRLIVDGGNGVAGGLAARALRALGCHVHEMFCEPDATHPHHLPDPSDPANLRELSYCLRYSDADFGVALDGDGQCMTLVTRSGDIVGPDQQLILLAQDLLARHPGAEVVHDIQSSRHVARAVAAAGGRAMPWVSGTQSVAQAMQAGRALLGGDALGHICLRDRWHGGVDAIYVLARILELFGSDPMAVLGQLPRSYATPPLRIYAGNVDPTRVLAWLADDGAFLGAARAGDARGVRVDFNDGFGSAWRGWQPQDLVFRFEGDTPQALDRIQEAFRRRIRRVAPRLRLPF